MNYQQMFEEILSAEKYRDRLSRMALMGGNAFTLDFEDVLSYNIELAKGVVDCPDEFLKHASAAARQRLFSIMPEYAERANPIVRISPLPTATPIRMIGAKHIGKLIMIEGIVVRSTPVLPLVIVAGFRCRVCGEITRVPQEGEFLRQPYRCRNPDCARSGYFDLVESESEYIDSQNLRVQELPEELPPGQIPTSLDLRVTGSDLMDVARPGDQVKVVGIIRTSSLTTQKGGKLRTQRVYVDVNNIAPESRELELMAISPEEEAKIKELAADPAVHQKIVQSIAPSMYGNEHIKEACMYLLFGGVPKKLPDINIRGDINVLIIGDPSTFKSQLLRYVVSVAPRGIYTTGRGTSAAGLTASVVRTEKEGVTLEAGAMVLADRGVVAIDEFDKMRPEDRVAIHTAMEQQVVPVAKGGIVATLNARTAVLAAANPGYGRYVDQRTAIENINLPPTILSRFDLIFVLRDIPNLETDSKITMHVLDLHGTGGESTPIDQNLLRKYIAYSKNINPVLTPEARERIYAFYLKMRQASTEGSISITLRQLESLIRIAEARARAALRTEVTAEDAEAAILIMDRSLRDVGIDTSTNKIDIDIILTGKPKSVRDALQILLGVIAAIERETGMADLEAVYQEAEKRGIPRVHCERLIAQLKREGMVFEPRMGFIKKT